MSQIRINKGEKKQFEIHLRKENGDPFDLTGYDKFRVALPKGSGQALTVTQVANGNGSVVAVLGSATLGVLQVTVGRLDTAALVAGDRLSIDLEIDVTATPAPRRERFVDSLAVIDNLIPNT